MAAKTIKSMIADINNEESDGGGLWPANIQRLFVCGESQIERLFDSVCVNSHDCASSQNII